MKGAIPLSANGNTSGWERRECKGKGEGKQDASTEQKYAKREGGELKHDWIHAAVRLIWLRLS